ncbi:MAG TPA: sucrase ferredoxin [Gaiellaceae bacterium]|nr:sucrase ferredoxin [Gaiellaceae bacterium]
MSEAACSELSRAAAEPLAGTATVARCWLLVEHAGRWERDVAETVLPEGVRAAVDAFDGRVQLIRRTDRRGEEAGAAFLAEAGDDGTRLVRLPSPTSHPTADAEGRPVSGLLLLVCCHGRRDPCCARAGIPVYEALSRSVPAERLWQSSHLGGHRFAANLLALPAGILLGRVTAGVAPQVAAELAAGRIPLEHYRGRTVHAPPVQAADAAVRRRLDARGIDDVRLLGERDGVVRLDTPAGELAVRVEAEAGPPLVESCGKDAVPSVRYSVRW